MKPIGAKLSTIGTFQSVPIVPITLELVPIDPKTCAKNYCNCANESLGSVMEEAARRPAVLAHVYGLKGSGSFPYYIEVPVRKSSHLKPMSPVPR